MIRIREDSCVLLLNLNERRKLPPVWQAVVGIFSYCGDMLVRRECNVRGQGLQEGERNYGSNSS